MAVTAQLSQCQGSRPYANSGRWLRIGQDQGAFAYVIRVGGAKAIHMQLCPFGESQDTSQQPMRALPISILRGEAFNRGARLPNLDSKPHCFDADWMVVLSVLSTKGGSLQFSKDNVEAAGAGASLACDPRRLCLSCDRLMQTPLLFSIA